MSPSEHIDDKLVDYAYGELSPSQMRDAQAHLQTCPRCTQVLDDIRSVRRVMSQLPTVPAPSDGIDSLVSYAQQRAKAHAKSQPLWVRWRRLVWPLAGAMACLALVVISSRVVTELRPLSSRLAQESARSKNVLAKSPPPQSAAKPPVFYYRAQPPVETPKDNLAEAEQSFDQRTRSDHSQMERSQQAADTSAEVEPKVALREKRDSTEEGPAVTAPMRRSAPRREPPTGRAGAGAAPNENKSFAYEVERVSPPSPPSSTTEYADRKSGERSGGSAKLNSKKAKGMAKPDDGVEGGVEGGVVGGVVGGIAGSAPASEEVGASGQRMRPSTPTSRYAQPPPKKSEPQESSESLGREVTSVRQSLNQGATGTERARLLNRLCELLFELGQELDAIAACDAVLKEFPDTPAARTARTLKANFSKAVPRPAVGKPGPSPSP